MSNISMEENREYIVFDSPVLYCDNYSKQYYDYRNTNLNYQGKIFPIVNENVIDEANDWDWRTSVPLATFKQNLQAVIDSIKNFGK